MIRYGLAAATLAASLIAAAAQAADAPAVTKSHALSLAEKPKYGPDFKHLDATQLAARLTAAGLEVDDLRGVAGEFDDVVVAEIESCGPHPDAGHIAPPGQHCRPGRQSS